MEILELPSPMIDQQYNLIRVSFPDFIHEIGALRIRAWRSEPGVDPLFFSRNTWIEALDQTAHHWVVTANHKVVAAARMSYHKEIDSVPYSSLLPSSYYVQYASKRIASINRLVVDPQFRGRGFARMLDMARLETARQDNIDVIVAQPQLSRLTTLTKQGFLFVSELPSTPEMPERPLFFMDLALSR